MAVTIADPPIFEHLLLENPWPLVAALGAVGVVLLILANRRRQSRLFHAAIVALMLAVGAFLLASYVTTQREELAGRTRRLVELTAPLQVPALEAMFAPNAVLSDGNGNVCLRAEGIFRDLEAALGRYPIADQSIRQVDAEVLRPGFGATEFDLSTSLRSEYGQSAIRTVWRVDWRRGGDGQWQITDIRWLKFQGKAPRCGMWR